MVLTHRLTDRMNTHHRVLLAAVLATLAYNATHGEKIIHGTKAKKNSLQYMASVQVHGKHTCGGFLIDSRYILTAAHCDTRKNLSVVLGTHSISEDPLDRYAVEGIHKPSSYKNPKNGNDIMLLKLSRKVKNSKFIKPINISSNDKPFKPNTKCQVAGWGRTENQNTASDLLVADVSIINLEDCKAKWKAVKTRLPHSVLCAGGYRTKSGACQGDSGGPLVCKGVAVGIVSFNLNQNCNYPNVPNVYTQISKYRAWIKKMIKKRA